MIRRFQLLLASTFMVFAPQIHAAESGLVFFESKVRPLLIKHCYECHSSKSGNREGGLLLDLRSGWESGGDSGSAIVPGEPEKSLLIEAVRYENSDLAMPPKEKLSESEIATFEQWVKMGAPDPREGEVAATREIDLLEGRKFWSFQSISDQSVPSVIDRAWPVSDIDRFVLTRLESEQLRPVTDADPRTLIRRATLDLIGLPPSPDEVEAFVNAHSRDAETAFRDLVDRLLQSLHFGERWGRHWLDIARYAESTGVNWNIPYPVAWRYRDYAIDAFNTDKPYDRFLHEQLAGDLLPATSDAQRNEQLIATGFLAIGQKDLQATTPRVYQMDIVDEQIDCISRSILGLSVACARCHDHKFDPIRTEDYYALAGIFTSTEPLSGVMRLKKKDLPVTRLQALAGVPDTMPESQRDELIMATYDAVNFSLKLRDTKQVLDNAREKKAEVAEIAKLEAEVDRLNTEQETALASFKKLNAQDHASLNGKAMAVRDAKPSDCPVLIRGEADRPGAVVPRGVPGVLTNDEGTLDIARGQSGRLELACWLTAPEHPLTARVMVNRVWQHLIGAGIVESVDDFGKTGQLPSHPELLDYLARRFIQNGWSVKQMIREIMLSRTYRLSSTHDAKAYDLDPANRLLWRANRVRLDSEALRDALLHVGGALELTRPVGSPVQQTANEFETYKVKGLFNPVVLSKRHLIEANKISVDTICMSDDCLHVHARGLLTRDYRFRSVYLPTIRGGATPVREAFDGAAPEEVVGQRAITTVPTQSLFMLNSAFSVECANRLAKRVYGSAVDEPIRIRLAFQYALGRPPTADELQKTAAFFTDYALLKNHEDATPDRALAWTVFCQTLLASAEFRYRY